MEIPFSPRYCLAFMAFVFIFGQLHEMAHLTAAYFICSEPGLQIDFNLWTLSKSCENSPYAYVPTIFGPLFSYACMWVGAVILKVKDKSYWPAAFVLIIGNLAFARLFTAGMGGGDETTVLKVLFNGQPVWLIKTIGFVLVFALAFPPLFMVYKRMAGKHRLAIIAGFCIVPLILMKLYEFMLLGKVLHAGFMSEAHFLGVPDFIYLHTGLMAVIVVLFNKSLFGASAKSLT